MCGGPYNSFVTNPYNMGFYGLPWTPAIKIWHFELTLGVVHVVLGPFLPNPLVGQLIKLLGYVFQEFDEFNSRDATCVPGCMHTLRLTPLVM